MIPLPGLSRNKGGGAGTLASLFVLTGLALAIACFSLATLPRTRMRWRPAAILVSERRANLTVVGFSFFAAAAVYFWIQGS